MPVPLDQDAKIQVVMERLRKRLLQKAKLTETIKKRDPHLYFCSCLGDAITKWATIDADLFTLFRFALNARNDVKAALLYYRANQISDHFLMVDMLIRLDLNKKPLRRWNELEREFNRLSPFRNRLAHDPLNAVVRLHRPIKLTEEEAAERARTRLRPPTPSAPDEKPGTYYELNIADTKLLRSLHKPVPPPIRTGDIERHLSDLWNFQVKIAEFMKTLPKRAVERALRPLAIPPRLGHQSDRKGAHTHGPPKPERRRRSSPP
jgi:hypothetical protein